ncbi:MAG: hypothetical protein KA243_12325 [Candidatus Aminicenantes bacterium]|nr:hypothetical protein [Candidatus Aminicenantes bacterium]
MTEVASSETELSLSEQDGAVSTHPASILRLRLEGLKRGFFTGILNVTLYGQPSTSVWGVHDSVNRYIEDQALTWIYHSQIGRPISRLEALAIVEAILEQAEKERRDIAIQEAKQLLWLEDET